MSFIDWRGPEGQEVVDKELIKGDRALTIPETGFKWHNTISQETTSQRPLGPALMRPGRVLAMAALGPIWGSLVHCQGQGSSVWD